MRTLKNGITSSKSEKLPDSPLLVEEQWLSPLISTLIQEVPPVYNKYATKNENEQIKIYIAGVIDDGWILTSHNTQ